MRQHHDLKTETEFYQKVESGLKRFEARLNDRNFQVGDMVTLIESVSGVLTGRKLGPFEIDYILHGPLYGIEEHFCVFTWKGKVPTKPVFPPNQFLSEGSFKMTGGTEKG